MTREHRNRLRELEALDEDGAPLTKDDYDELNNLLNIEDEQFVRDHDPIE